MTKLAVEISKDAKSNLARELTRMTAKVEALEGKLRTTAKTGQAVGKEMRSTFGPSALSGLKTYVTSVASVGTAIAALRAHYQTWQKDIRETSTEAKKAAWEIISLAALQEGGKKAEAVRVASKLHARYGLVGRRADVFDIVQAMQSRFQGDLTRGARAAETILAAEQVGIPIDLGRELEVLGGAQGQKPGQALRRAYVAGQLSEREPKTMARVAPALKFWGDKDVGFAVGAALAASVDPERARMQLESAGVALSTLSAKGFQKTLKRMGLAGKSQLEMLHGLRAGGIMTPEQLGAAGLVERKQIEALSTALLNLDKITSWAQQIPERAKPGLFARERLGIEAEIPATRIARSIRQTEAQYLDELAFGTRAEPAMVEELRERLRGLELRRMGRRRGLVGVDYFDEEGRVSPFAWFRAKMAEGPEYWLRYWTGQPGGPGFQPGAMERAEQRVERQIAEELRGPAASLERAAASIETAAQRMQGGPAMVPVSEDR